MLNVFIKGNVSAESYLGSGRDEIIDNAVIITAAK